MNPQITLEQILTTIISQATLNLELLYARKNVDNLLQQVKQKDAEIAKLRGRNATSPITTGDSENPAG